MERKRSGVGASPVSEVLTRYALSLAIGTSLDLHQNCRSFLKVLNARRKVGYASIWVNRSLLTGSGDAVGAGQIAAVPRPELGEASLGPDHPILRRLKSAEAISVGPDDPDFAHLSDRRKVMPGILSIFALGNIGILKIFDRGRTEPLSPIELGGFRDVVGKLTRSIAACQAYDRLRVSEAKFRTLFEESRDCVFISTPEGSFLDINRAGATMLGYSRGELLGMRVGTDLYADGSDWDAYRRRMDEVGYVQDYEIRLRRRDGATLVVLETSSRVRDETGDVVAYRGIMRDVTAQRALEQQLAQAQKMESLGQLAGGIAHDFNNLLTGILGYTSLLRMRVADDPVAMRYVATVEESGERAKELTSQLLGFARRGRYESRVMRLETAVAATLRLLDRLIGPSITIITELADGLPAVEVDLGQIQQVIMNLCINARDAMPHGGELRLKTYLAPARLVARPEDPPTDVEWFVSLDVTDTGMGIPDAIAQRIFEPFFTTKPKGQGTGLGLSLVYGVVENHGGRLKVESTLGVGTTFRVHLPASERLPEEVGESPAPIAGARASERVLVVDDDEVVRRLAKEILEAAGYQVVLASGGEEAVRRYRESSDGFQLVVLDIIMPEMNGRQVYDALREIDPEVRVLAASGFSQDSWPAHMLEAGACQFIRKPFDAPQLLRVVRQLLD